MRIQGTWRVGVMGVGLTLLVAAWVAAGNQDPKQTACASNMRQLCTGLMMYVQDYDEHFPPAERWASGVVPYTKNKALFNCPSDAKGNSYAFNRNLSRASISQIQQPASTAMLFESNLHTASPNGTAAAVAKPPRHNGGNNYGFADGHVLWLTAPPSFGKPLAVKAPARPRRKR